MDRVDRLHAKLPLLLLVALIPLGTGLVHAREQAPHDPWRTVETPSFRVHYPAAWEPWARHVVARLEPVRDVVADAVGYRPRGKVDVVLQDPIGRPNAFAISLLRSPRMVLWGTPPDAGSAIGSSTDWTELLVLHEDVHLVHLLRPSRSPSERAASRLFGLGPLSRKTPRWAIEGYATLLEGRLTGSGRPNADFRAAVLRARARAGALPDYGALGRTGDGWQDGGMAYLAGSSFLEWLAVEEGRDALPDVWRRLSARRSRSFDEAFEGVFGEPPDRRYGRFVAVATARALEVERRIGDAAVEGEVLLELDGATGAPAASPDGTRFAVVVRPPGEPASLAIHAIDPDERAIEERRREIERALERDPEDVAPVDPAVPPRERLHVLRTRHGADPHAPRFLPSGEAVLYHAFVPDARGVLRPDLFAWRPADGAVARITRGADVRDGDPAPDGTWAAAVRIRGGLGSLVRVDLLTGAVEPLLDAPAGEVLDRPRVSPDGGRIVFLRQREGRWRVEILDLAGGAAAEVPLPADLAVADPAWAPDGRALWVTLGRDGFLDVARLDLDAAAGAIEPRFRTRSLDGVVAPEPLPGGRGILAAGLHARGIDVRRVDGVADLPPLDARFDPGLAPMVRPVPPADPPRADPGRVDPGPHPARPYGGGRPEVRGLLAWNAAPSVGQAVAGIRVGDVVGRWELLALGAAGGRVGPRGAAVGAAWRGWPVELRARAFGTRERPSEQDRADPDVGDALDLDRTGVEVEATVERRSGPVSSWDVGFGASFEAVEPAAAGAASYDREVAFVRAAVGVRPSWGRWRLEGTGTARWDAGRSDSVSWRRASAAVGVGLGRGPVSLSVTGRWAEARDAVVADDRIALGGTDGAVLASTALAGRVVVPALPVGSRVGDDYRGGRAALRLGRRMPVELFAETHRVRGGVVSDDGPLELVGVEWIARLDAQPIVRLPATAVRIGVARVERDPLGRLDDRTRGWVTVSWRP